MIAFIDDHRAAYGVEPICRVLPIAPSTYRDHVARRRDPAKRAIFTATAHAQRAADFLHGLQPTTAQVGAAA